jgi:predicted RNase H-like nuclease (RuvC/YqgF family)
MTISEFNKAVITCEIQKLLHKKKKQVMELFADFEKEHEELQKFLDDNQWKINDYARIREQLKTKNKKIKEQDRLIMSQRSRIRELEMKLQEQKYTITR